MISVLAYYLDQNDVGPGFYTDAIRLGLLEPSPSSDAKLRFWIGQRQTIAGRCGA